MDLHCAARTGSFQATDTLVDRTHAEVASVHPLLSLICLPRWAQWVAERVSRKSGELQKALRICRGRSRPGWPQFPRGPPGTVFLA
ncbi:hypothetical protein HispidOSU_010016, partial [Sigmodon hispidus]